MASGDTPTPLYAALAVLEKKCEGMVDSGEVGGDNENCCERFRLRDEGLYLWKPTTSAEGGLPATTVRSR